MGIVSEKLIGFVYRDPTTLEYILMYPKTVGVQVALDDGSENTAHDHVRSNCHISRFDHQKLDTINVPNGLAVLDENGFIGIDQLDPSLVIARIEHANIASMLQDSTTLTNSMVFVVDASADPTVEDGHWALYRRTAFADYTSLENGWLKVAERESLDLQQTWVALASILPDATPAEIDDMVAKMHYHTNLEVLNAMDASEDGEHFSYLGEEIALRKDVTHWHFGDYFPDGVIAGGDMWIKSVPGQLWWYSDTVEYAGVSCYEKYANQDYLISAPRLRTQDSKTFRRMFYNDTALEEIPQYNFESALDVSGFIQECHELKSIPYMNTYKCENFDRMASGCSKLIYGPEVYMYKATSMEDMYAGCTNLLRTLSFGSTSSVANMKGAFRGCSALTSIDTILDFSSITSPANVSDLFYDCIELENVKFKPNTLTVSLSMDRTNLSVDSILSVFDGLAPYEGDPMYAPMLSMYGVEAVGLLTAAQRGIPESKGWKFGYTIDVGAGEGEVSGDGADLDDLDDIGQGGSGDLDDDDAGYDVSGDGADLDDI